MRNHKLYLKDIFEAMEAIEGSAEGRDKLIHFYFGIKYELVWQTIKDVIPQVKPLIGKILNET